MKGNLVKDWMTPDPITITSDMAIPEAYWLMMNKRVRRLLVVDNGVLVGIVTVDDLRQKIPFTTFAMDAVRASDILSHYPVRQVFSQNPKTISPDTALVDAAKMMLEYKISALPVIQDSKVVGIITESDIFRAFVAFAQEN